MNSSKKTKTKFMIVMATLVLVASGSSYLLGRSERGLFPKTVARKCVYEWVTNYGSPFLSLELSTDVDILNAAGALEERAYVFLKCGRKFVLPLNLEKNETECHGVKMSGLFSESLQSGYIDAIDPEDVTVASEPGQDPVVIKWTKNSTFTIQNKRQFSRTLKSALTGNTHIGSVACSE